MRESLPIGIVGDGRVAAHFQHYLRLLGHPVRAWSRSREAGSPAESLAACETVLLLIRDGEIESFIRQRPALLEAGLAAHVHGDDPIAAARAVLKGLDVEYVSVADFGGRPTLAVAARVGRTRLIDNARLDDEAISRVDAEAADKTGQELEHV